MIASRESPRPIDSNDPWNDRSQLTLMTLRMVDLNDSWNDRSQLTLMTPVTPVMTRDDDESPQSIDSNDSCIDSRRLLVTAIN